MFEDIGMLSRVCHKTVW